MQVVSGFFVIAFLAAALGVIKPYTTRLNRWQFFVLAVACLLLAATFAPANERGLAAVFIAVFAAAALGAIKPFTERVTRWQFAVVAAISFVLFGAIAGPSEGQKKAAAAQKIADAEVGKQEVLKPQPSPLAEKKEIVAKPVETAATGISDSDIASRIGADAISKYTDADRKHYPKLFGRLGSRLYEVEGLGRKAAVLALRTGKCDRVLFVDVSDRSTRNELQFYVDCDNETRVRLTETEIKAGQAANAESKGERQSRVAARMVRDDRLITEAKAQVRRVLRDPNSADFANMFVSEKNGLVTCGFVNARNGFGGMSGQQAFIAFSNRIAMPTDADFKAKWDKHCSVG